MILKKILEIFRDIFCDTQYKACFVASITLISIYITTRLICLLLDVYPKILDHWLVGACIASVIAFLSWSIAQIYTTWSQSKQPHVNLLTNENPLSLAEARISSFNRDIRELKQDREKEIEKLIDLRQQNNNQNGEELNSLIQKTEKRIEQIDCLI
jgi:hypothetical protein